MTARDAATGRFVEAAAPATTVTETVKSGGVEARVTDLEARVAGLEGAVRFLLSLLHPAPIIQEGPPPPSWEAWHAETMRWLERYGGRITPAEPEEGATH